MRIFALSDIHADYEKNLQWVKQLSDSDYTHDVLLIGGDVSHDMGLLCRVLEALREKFSRVFFVPGNHDLWLRSSEPGDSLSKCANLLDHCERLDVRTGPEWMCDGTGGAGVWIVPLFAWYVKPEEDPAESLFVPKQGEDPKLRMWVDDRAVRWPLFDSGAIPATYFLQRSRLPSSAALKGRPVISFSHFVPRAELIFPTPAELQAHGIPLRDPQPRFNFSRVAGCRGLDRRIRALGSAVHVYGHQHRNRRRRIEGITYVSHCLGYPRERAEGRISSDLRAPLPVWDTAASSTEPISVFYDRCGSRC